MTTQKELEDKIEESISKLEPLSNSDSYPWAVRSAYHLALVMFNTSKTADISTQRVVILTKVLAVLTFLLFILAVVQVALMVK